MAERQRESIPDRRSSGRESSGADSGKADPRYFEAEWIKGRAEGSGGLVRMEALREISGGGVLKTFEAEEAELVHDSFIQRKPVERVKEWRNMV